MSIHTKKHSTAGTPTYGIREDPQSGLGFDSSNNPVLYDPAGNVIFTGGTGSIDFDASTITTGIGVAADNANALTSGQVIKVASSGAGTQITGAGRLILSDHTGNATGSGILNEFKSAAADETVIVKINATAALAAGIALDISAVALTTGKLIDMSDLDAITTGKAIHVDATGVTQTDGILVHVDSASTALTSTGRLLLVDHTGASTVSSVIAEIKSTANDETTLLGLTATALTTGTVVDFGTLAALTTGVGIKIAHTTSVIADTGSLVRITSSSIDTGGATNGTLLDLRSTAQVAGTCVRLDSVVTTGTAMSIIGTGTMTTTGNLLTITGNSATTAAGLLRVNCNGITDGIGAVIASSATASTATGRLLRVDHTGATTASGAGIISEIASAATDATTVTRITASGALAAGVVLDLSGTAVTTGTILDMGGLDALTTGIGVNLVSNSSSSSTRSLVFIKNDHTSATAATCLELVNDAPLGAIKTTVAATSTNFFKVGVFNGVTLWVGNGNTGNAALSGTAGDLLLNGASNKPEHCTGTTNWTALL